MKCLISVVRVVNTYVTALAPSCGQHWALKVKAYSPTIETPSAIMESSSMCSIRRCSETFSSKDIRGYECAEMNL